MDMIRDMTARLGIEAEPELVTVKTDEEAVRLRHIGGPTVQVEGLDIEPEARSVTRYGLS